MGNLEILIGAVAAFLFGFAWYTVLFGAAWRAETGMTEEEAGKNIAMTHGLAFLMMCIIAFGINFVINMHSMDEQTFVHGAFHGALSAGIYCVPAMSIHYLYQKKSIKLWLIDGAYILLFCALMGGIMAALKLGVA